MYPIQIVDASSTGSTTYVETVDQYQIQLIGWLRDEAVVDILRPAKKILSIYLPRTARHPAHTLRPRGVAYPREFRVRTAATYGHKNNGIYCSSTDQQIHGVFRVQPC